MKSVKECWDDLDKWLSERRSIIPKHNPYNWRGTIQRSDWVSADFIPGDTCKNVKLACLTKRGAQK